MRPRRTDIRHVPYLLAVNLTARCNLSCMHCYMDAGQRLGEREGELTHAEVAALFDDIARRAPGTIVVLTGGEPLLRDDIEDITASGVAAGLRVVLGTNGVLLSDKRIRRFKEIGLSGVGVSLDGVDADTHDAFRGVRGAFDRSTEALRRCRTNNLHAQIHFAVMRTNYEQVRDVAFLARELGVSAVNYFFLVCVGRGRSYQDLPADQYERSLKIVAGLQSDFDDLLIQSRCTPHFKRILYQRDPESPYTRATGYDGGGCLAGTGYCRVTPEGEVTPCPYMSLSAGNIRRQPFWEIWDRSPLFDSLRHPALQGRCSFCEFRLLCGGCRARGLAETGRLMGEDPSCSYVPRGEKPIGAEPREPLRQGVMAWEPEARARLGRIPAFLRKRVERRLEETAISEGSSVVTVTLMERLRKERGKEHGPRFQ